MLNCIADTPAALKFLTTGCDLPTIPQLCSFGQAPAQDVVCAAFLPPGLDAAVELLGGQAIKGNVPPAEGRGTRRTGGLDFNPNEGMIATGHPNGEVYFWRNR